MMFQAFDVELSELLLSAMHRTAKKEGQSCVQIEIWGFRVPTKSCVSLEWNKESLQTKWANVGDVELLSTIFALQLLLYNH